LLIENDDHIDPEKWQISDAGNFGINPPVFYQKSIFHVVDESIKTAKSIDLSHDVFTFSPMTPF